MGDLLPVLLLVVTMATGRTCIPSKFWTERVGALVALAARNVKARQGAAARMRPFGAGVRTRREVLAAAPGLPLVFSGRNANGAFGVEGRDAAPVELPVTQRLLAEGHVAGQARFVLVADGPAVLVRYLEVRDRVFADLAHMDDDDVQQVIGPEPAWTGFGRLA